MKLVDFTLTERFNTTALDVYTILTDERRHSSMTSDIAQISDTEGSTFSFYDGLITGKNIALERGKKIIWSIKLADANWPEHHLAEAAILLTDDTASTCTVELFLTAVPADFERNFRTLWVEKYWEPLHYYLAR
mgnify:CR=1 FL=1